MRWIILMPVCWLLTACIYTEGQYITEPEDIVVSPNVYCLTPNYPCDGKDLGQPSKKDASKRFACDKKQGNKDLK